MSTQVFRPFRLSLSFGLVATATAGSALAVAACSSDSSGAGGACGSLIAGDLVITEVMANPAGADDEGVEWFELYNATSEAIDLEGFILVASKSDMTGVESHRITALTIEPGTYVVVGATAEDAKPAYVDYGYGSELGNLNNTAGRLGIGCGDVILDDIDYEESPDGVSRSFDGTVAPDGAGNDDLSRWCDAKTEFDTESFGTPGLANDACANISATTCMDGDTEREIVPPPAGDLVISEIHADPDAVADATGEYFELYAKSDFDLNGLQVGEREGEYDYGIGGETCLAVTTGQYILVTVNGDTAVNGGLPDADYDLGSGTFLNNSAGDAGLYIARNDELLDAVPSSGGLVGVGASANLSANQLDVTANDDPANWCESTMVYGDGDMGTPKAANETCPGSVPSDMCEEGGALRAIRAPAVGDFVISEFHPNPAAVPDGDGEYFEIYATKDLDLNGLKTGRDVNDIPEAPLFDAVACLPIAQGEYALVAQESSDAVNGGLSMVDALLDFSLVNGGGAIFIAYEDTIIDEITWASSGDGVATGLDPTMLDASANDNAANWCPQTSTYGDGDAGTPRGDNDVCTGGGGDMCNDGGTPRMIDEPQPGEVIINEVMANPDGSAETQKEWFELYITADVDLNNLVFSTTSSGGDSETITDTDCLSFGAGDYVVIARNADMTANAGVTTVDIEYPGAFAMTNTSGDLTVAAGGMTLDSFSWNVNGTTDGRSLSLDPDFQDTTDNDNEDNWCDAAVGDAYGLEDNAGTPGQANPQCP